MKKILLILLMCAVSLLAQKVTVIQDAAVTSLNEGSFYYPVLNPDGTGIIYSTVNHQGLWYKNLTSGKSILITDAEGAGFEPGFSSKRNEIIYRKNNFVNGQKLSSILSYDLTAKKSAALEEGIRDLKILKDAGGESNNYIKDKSLRSMQSKKKSAGPIVSVENSNIALYENDKKRILEPMGKGNYLWTSISPDKNKLLFTFMGKGTFVSDLNGKIIAKIGHANYPSWSPDGKWIVFMKDFDNGLKLTSSDIFIVDSAGKRYFNLTEGKVDIALYPKFGNSKSEIFYNTESGEIRKIKLKFQ